MKDISILFSLGKVQIIGMLISGRYWNVNARKNVLLDFKLSHG